MRVLLSIVAFAGCYADVRMGASAPIGHGHGSTGGDIGIGIGADHRGERIRAGGGFNLGGHLTDGKNGWVPLGGEGRIDIGLTEPNERGTRLVAVGLLALGIARGYSQSDDVPAHDGAYAQAFLGIGLGNTQLTYPYEPRKLEAGSVAIGILMTRFAPFDDADSYWLIGGALSLSYGLSLNEISNDAFSGD